MHKTKTYITPISIILLVIYSMMLISTLNSTFSKLDKLGLLSLLTILVLSNALFLWHLSISKVINKQILPILIIGLAFCSIGLIGLINNSNTRSFITLFQFITLIGFTSFASMVKYNKFRLGILRVISIFFLMITSLIWIAQGMPFFYFKSIYPNPNLIGIILFTNLFFILVQKRKSNFVFTFMTLFLIYFSGSRAVILSSVICFMTYVFWKVISKNKMMFKLYLYIVLSFLLSFIFIYPKIIEWDSFYKLNDFVLDYSGKNIYSGREYIWSILIDKINEKPFFGFGTGILPENIMNTGFSAHNYYLQIALQNGYIGLSVIIILLIYIWSIFYKNKRNRVVRLSSSFFIGLLVYLSFEVSLTQNQVASGIFMWLIIAIGISESINTNQDFNR